MGGARNRKDKGCRWRQVVYNREEIEMHKIRTGLMVVAALSLSLATGCVTDQDQERLVSSLERLIDAVEDELDGYGVENQPEAGNFEMVPVGEIHRSPSPITLGGESVVAIEWGYWAYDVDDVGNPLANESVFHVSIVGIGYTDDPDNALGLGNFRTITGEDRRNYTPPTLSATWRGKARAINADLEAAEGSATVTYRSILNSVEVLITDLENNDLRSLYWRDMPVVNGEFSNVYPDLEESHQVSGAFYGRAHEGVAGDFRTPHLLGVFGALRD